MVAELPVAKVGSTSGAVLVAHVHVPAGWPGYSQILTLRDVHVKAPSQEGSAGPSQGCAIPGDAWGEGVAAAVLEKLRARGASAFAGSLTELLALTAALAAEEGHVETVAGQ